MRLPVAAVQWGVVQSGFPRAFGRYVLLKPLGQGGMSTVCLAMSGHRELETICVVKRLLPALASQPEHVRRFRHEADLARRLAHSNLVNTHNIGEVDGEVFLVQEYVEGQDVSALLDELANRRRSLPIPIAVHIAGEIARGLSYAHAFENLRLVHRDINQPNVRLTYAGEVKLLDFGIASSRLHGERSGEHDVRGKLWHLAPEQIRPGTTVDHRADIYAVGVLLWELLTGRPVGTTRAGGDEGRTPETEGEVMVWIMRGQHQAPSAFNPEVSSELDALVARAMHVDPDQRHPSADELRRALTPFMASDLHPEQQLSTLMKELFSPERERIERQRLVELGRDLLRSEGGPSREMPEMTGAGSRRPARRRSDVARRHAVWIAPVAIGALAGLACLFYLRGTPQPTAGSVASPATVATAPGLVAAKPSLALSSPPAPPPAKRAAELVPQAHAPPSAPNRPETATSVRAQPAAPPPVATPPADEPPTAPPPTAAQQGVGSKTDHLELAREAFNLRDWPRALAEGKNAVAAGGGAEAHALVGNTYFKMGRFAEAEKSYARAAALDPRNALLRERLRIAHARAEQAENP
jgi:serine/threonine protein kinase